MSFQTEERSKTGEKTQEFTHRGLPHVPFVSGYAPSAHEAVLLLPYALSAPYRRHLHLDASKNCFQLVFQAGSVQKARFSSPSCLIML